MCGRFTLTSPERAIREVLDAAPDEELASSDPLEELLTPRYNVAPTQTVPVIRPVERTARSEIREREVAGLRWGLVPEWSRDPAIGSKLINARSETLRDKPSFRDAFEHRRCLVPTDGFFEWTAAGRRQRQPWWIHRPGREPFAFAGLWENGTFTIVTCEATGAIRELHERMPVMLFDRAARRAWLESDLETVAPLLVPRDNELVFHRVSLEVNRNDFEDPRAILEAAPLPAYGSPATPRDPAPPSAQLDLFLNPKP